MDFLKICEAKGNIRGWHRDFLNSSRDFFLDHFISPSGQKSQLCTSFNDRKINLTHPIHSFFLTYSAIKFGPFSRYFYISFLFSSPKEHFLQRVNVPSVYHRIPSSDIASFLLLVVVLLLLRLLVVALLLRPLLFFFRSRDNSRRYFVVFFASLSFNFSKRSKR